MIIKNLVDIEFKVGQKFEMNLEFSQEATTSFNTQVTSEYTIADDDLGDHGCPYVRRYTEMPIQQAELHSLRRQRQRVTLSIACLDASTVG